MVMCILKKPREKYSFLFQCSSFIPEDPRFLWILCPPAQRIFLFLIASSDGDKFS